MDWTTDQCQPIFAGEGKPSVSVPDVPFETAAIATDLKDPCSASDRFS